MQKPRFSSFKLFKHQPPSLQSIITAVAVPAGLLPTHWYFPASCGIASLITNSPPSSLVVILSLSCRGLLSFVHVMVGIGTPTAAQLNTNVSPCITGISPFPTVTRGGTVKRQFQEVVIYPVNKITLFPFCHELKGDASMRKFGITTNFCPY